MKLRFAIRLVMTRADYALLFPTTVPIYWLSVYSGELRPVSAWLNLESFSKDRPEPFYNSYLVTITATERQAILESPDYFACLHLVLEYYTQKGLMVQGHHFTGKTRTLPAPPPPCLENPCQGKHREFEQLQKRGRKLTTGMNNSQCRKKQTKRTFWNKNC